MKKALYAMVLGALVTTQGSWACQDPELHKKHIQEEFERAQKANEARPQIAPTPKQSALDDERSFFQAIGKSSDSPQK